MTIDRIRSALFLPASNPRAIAKARTLAADLVILDLEDAVRDTDKEMARVQGVSAAADWPGNVAIRVNAVGTSWYDDDMAAIAAAGVRIVVVPKVESVDQLADLPCPALAMIETPAGVYAAREIAQAPAVVGLLAGSNDLAAALRVTEREGLAFSLQAILLAARAAGIVALDGVYNAIDDASGFEADCAIGRRLGFDGKCLIHPSQVDAANRLFGPSAAELEQARALIGAYSGGAERFEGRMIENMHVEAARRLLGRAGAT